MMTREPGVHTVTVGKDHATWVDRFVTDASLALIAKLPKLESLNLTNTAVTEAGLLEHLSDAPALAKLNLIGCKQIKGKAKRLWEKAGEKLNLKRDVVD